MDLTPLFNALLAGVASFIGAWLAARFALHRFYQEKTWERKLAAYTAIFEAIYDMNRWFTIQRNLAVRKGQSLPPEEEQRLRIAYDEAQSVLRRRLAVETWLIPATIASRVDLGLKELSTADDIDDWLHYLHAGTRITSDLINGLSVAVRSDLRIRNVGPPVLYRLVPPLPFDPCSLPPQLLQRAYLSRLYTRIICSRLFCPSSPYKFNSRRFIPFPYLAGAFPPSFHLPIAVGRAVFVIDVKGRHRTNPDSTPGAEIPRRCTPAKDARKNAA
jgi:hypothetical protein